MLRFRSNCIVMLVEPNWLVEVICVDAGDAPELTFQRRGHRGSHRLRTGAGQRAPTWIVGKSTCGSGATGSNTIAQRPGQQQAMRQQRGRYRPMDERGGDVHASVSAGGAARRGSADTCSGRTAAPSRSNAR